MDEQMFLKELEKHGIQLNDQQLRQFQMYYEMLIEWNKKMNLTAIVEKEEVYLKHFFDSITLSFFFDLRHVQSICDVGAGAGFPSIPLKICFPHLNITIVDSLKKRITFLQSLTSNLELDGVQLVHGRAEDFGQQKAYRENFDLITARAVARLVVLNEYCLPLTKVGGSFISLKGPQIEEELNEAKKSIKLLGGELVKHHKFYLPIEQSERSIVIMDKVHPTKKKYPRKAGLPAKSPLL